MNRTHWIIAGIVLALVIVGLLLFPKAQPNIPPAASAGTPPVELVYCSNEPLAPCVVSFSVDAWDNMLVNLLLPDLSFPPFYLTIARGGVETAYPCQRVSYALNTAYCAGPKQPPGEPLTLRLIASKDQTLFAEGNLSIIGLAFPTLGVALYTPPQETPSAIETVVSSPEPFSTESPPPFVLPTRTKPAPTFYPPPSYP
ncbi:MAG: hypothetical protein ACOYYF_11960 [Chloroflexota bacterium]|nr:hypothetical protein [Chloroflexota bacterium]MBI5702323.1 hypothetical protein [Chloroflexota bacterium]